MYTRDEVQFLVNSLMRHFEDVYFDYEGKKITRKEFDEYYNIVHENMEILYKEIDKVFKD